MYGQIAEAKAAVASGRFLQATHAFMTPNRWEWIEQSFDSNNRPLVVPQQNGPWNAVQTTDAPTAEGPTGGRMMSLNIEQDFNIPVLSSNDTILVCRPDDFVLYESPVVARALPQTFGAQMSVLLQVYGYVAFTAARYPVSAQSITGSGLVTPPVWNS